MTQEPSCRDAEVIRMVLDDLTVARLRDAADARGIDVQDLMGRLLAAASARIDELLEER